MVKKIGILTSGGDCAGLNAVIRAATLRAINQYNWEIYGIKDGTLGLMKRPVDAIKLSTSFFDGNLVCHQIIYYISRYLLNTIY